jgi:hypothetical protein
MLYCYVMAHEINKTNLQNVLTFLFIQVTISSYKVWNMLQNTMKRYLWWHYVYHQCCRKYNIGLHLLIKIIETLKFPTPGARNLLALESCIQFPPSYCKVHN